MALLGAITYDPGTAVAKSTASLLAMTALDTTNLRIAFVAPTNGCVLVHLRTVTTGGNTPSVLLGVLDGSTVKGRIAALSPRTDSSGNVFTVREASFVVTGLTPGTTYTWDAAYAVQAATASTAIRYGGPNNTTGEDAWGSFVFEIWETANLLAGTLYDPGAAVAKSTGAALAMTAFDTTNLRLTFTAPATGRVVVRIHAGVGFGVGGTNAATMLGVMDGATVKCRVPGHQAVGATSEVYVGGTYVFVYGNFPVTSLTPGVSYTWDAAYGIEYPLVSGAIRYGGPNDASGDDAWGGFAYEIWSA